MAVSFPGFGGVPRALAVALRRPALRWPLVAAAAAGAGAAAAVLPPAQAATWVVFAVAVAAAIRRPRTSILLLTALLMLLPFAVVPFRAVVRPPIFETGLALTLSVLALRAIRSPLRAPAVHWAVAGMLLAGAVSTALGARAGASAEQLQYAAKLGLGVLAFFAGASLGTAAEFRLGLAKVIALAGAVQAAVASTLYLAGTGAEGFFEALAAAGYPPGETALRYLPDGVTLRAIGTAVDPNVLGATLAVALPIAIWLAANAARGRRLAWSAAAALIALGILLSFSRGAWIGAGAGVLLLTALRRPRLAAGLLFVGALALLLPGGPGPLAHLRSGLLADDPASALRLDEYREAARVIASAPIFGVGFPAREPASYFLGVSSVPLWIAERAGLLGAGLSILAVVLAFRGGWSGRAGGAGSRWPRDAASGAGMWAAALAAALFAGLVDHHFASIPHMAALFWLLAGVLAARPEETPGSVARRA